LHWLRQPFKTEQIEGTTSGPVQKPFGGHAIFVDAKKFLPHVPKEEYIGQTLYLKGKSEDQRNMGYRGFYTNLNRDTGLSSSPNIYKCNSFFNSNYEDLVGKYFKVLSAIKPSGTSDTGDGAKYFLVLQQMNKHDTIYYEYDSQYDFSFPFIVLGFYEKQKKKLIGEKFIFANETLESSIDINTGKRITNKHRQIWTCTDLTIEENNYDLALKIKNSNGEETTIPYNTVFGDSNSGKKAYELNEAEMYKNRFGIANWIFILGGKVDIGFTKEMVELSWGKPEEVNYSSYGEQWVYNNQYLYFKNGKLTGFN